jgi:hypothetical protein
MRVVIDTNSLLSLVRYYLPFDKNLILFNFIKEKIANGEIIIIDKILTECTYNSQGLVIEKLAYLEDKEYKKSAKLPYKTDSLIVPSTRNFFHLLNNVFVNNVIKKQRKITDTEFESLKNQFLEDADMKLVILCLNLIKDNPNEEIFLVTEETENSNDNKLFKKIPAICKELGIKTKTLPELLELYNGIDVEFK